MSFICNKREIRLCPHCTQQRIIQVITKRFRSIKCALCGAAIVRSHTKIARGVREIPVILTESISSRVIKRVLLKSSYLARTERTKIKVEKTIKILLSMFSSNKIENTIVFFIHKSVLIAAARTRELLSRYSAPIKYGYLRQSGFPIREDLFERNRFISFKVTFIYRFLLSRVRSKPIKNNPYAAEEGFCSNLNDKSRNVASPIILIFPLGQQRKSNEKCVLYIS